MRKKWYYVYRNALIDRDDNFHGTNVASIIGANIDNIYLKEVVIL